MTNPQNPNDDTLDDDEFEWDGPSKSQLKRDAHRLQQLGIELSKLKPEELAKIPLTSALETALSETKNLKKNEAIRRHHQLIGKLMRSADSEAIIEALDKIREVHERQIQMSHTIEQWRDQLINGDQTQMERFMDEHPQCDRQQIRHLIRGAQKDLSQNKPPANARKLFKFLRDTMTPEAE